MEELQQLVRKLERMLHHSRQFVNQLYLLTIHLQKVQMVDVEKCILDKGTLSFKIGLRMRLSVF
jgi:hypothetical protein